MFIPFHEKEKAFIATGCVETGELSVWATVVCELHEVLKSSKRTFSAAVIAISKESLIITSAKERR